MGTYEENIIPIKISQLAEHVAKVKRIALEDALVYILPNTEALYEEFELCRKRQSRNISKEVFDFYTYCLENYAISKRISGLSAWTIFKESGADDYVIENYDLLHTQGLEYLLDDIQRFIKRRKR